MYKVALWIGAFALLATAITIALREVFVGLVAAVEINRLPDVLTGYVACLVIGAAGAASLVVLGRHLVPVAPARERRASFAVITQPEDRLPAAPPAFVRKIVDVTPPPQPKGQFEFRVAVGGVLEARTIPAHYLRRFFECPTPKREEWRGTAKTYGDILAVAKHYHWVEDRTDGENGYHWVGEWGNPDRRLGRVSLLTGSG